MSNLHMGNPRLQQWGFSTAALGRRLAHPAGISICVLLLLLLAILHGCPKSSFEQAQARAEAGNPHWLSIELDTADKRRQYKESEVIAFTVGYSSAVGNLYKAEVAENSSFVAASDTLHLSDGHTASLRVFGLVCCGSSVIGLIEEPYAYHPQLRLRLKPGTHEMYVTTHRVFPWDIVSQVYTQSEWETASNMLKLRILPDPGWQERQLAKINSKSGDPSKCAALSMLDIPAATAQKLELIRYGVPCQWQWEFNETEYATALKGMEPIIQSPTHGVIQYDVNLTLRMRNWLAYPEFRHIPEDREAHDHWLDSSRSVFVESEKGFVRELCQLLPTKTPDARQVTQHTIDELTAAEGLRDLRCH
jgi:hypothetical protein